MRKPPVSPGMPSLFGISFTFPSLSLLFALETISNEELQEINRAILTRYGMDFSNYETTSLRRRVTRVMRKIEVETVYDLWRYFLRHNEFIFEYVDELTVGLTEMFRNPELWALLRDEIIPEKINQGVSPINIWHAGCSTGEEVYSMAIVLHDVGALSISRAIATDLSWQAVRQAQEGVFQMDTLLEYEKAFRHYDPRKSLNMYYHSIGEEAARMKPFLTSHATFYQHNLSKDPMSSGQFDIIFCRNVMIYFDAILKTKVLEMFHRCLRPGGLLIIGYYDALPSDNERLFEMTDPARKVLRKKEIER